jgi:septum formation protein
MKGVNMNIVLATQSPRRKELFKYITSSFITVTSNVDERYSASLKPHEVVLHLSKIKAQSIYRDYPNDLIIGCDTIVSINDNILEKPQDANQAFEMLKLLSGNTHRVMTGVTLIRGETIDSFYSSTDVSFYPLTNEEIHSYIKTKEPFDKAGAYGIQGYASKFVEKINGDYFTVMGLPVACIYQKIKALL